MRSDSLYREQEGLQSHSPPSLSNSVSHNSNELERGSNLVCQLTDQCVVVQLRGDKSVSAAALWTNLLL